VSLYPVLRGFYLVGHGSASQPSKTYKNRFKRADNNISITSCPDLNETRFLQAADHFYFVFISVCHALVALTSVADPVP
jgi:hypothetical protein